MQWCTCSTVDFFDITGCCVHIYVNPHYNIIYIYMYSIHTNLVYITLYIYLDNPGYRYCILWSIFILYEAPSEHLKPCNQWFQGHDVFWLFGNRGNVACTQVLCSCTHASRITTRPQLGTKHSWALGRLSQLRTSRTSSGSPVKHSLVQKDKQHWWSSDKIWTRNVSDVQSQDYVEICRVYPALHTFNASRCLGPRAQKCCS